MFPRKKFSNNRNIIAETEAYFEAKNQPYHKNGVEKLQDRYNRIIKSKIFKYGFLKRWRWIYSFFSQFSDNVIWYQKWIFNFCSLSLPYTEYIHSHPISLYIS